MKNSLITNFEQKQFANRKPLPTFRPGDTVRVHYKIQEGADKEKFRVQAFEGVVIKRKKGTANSSFTVRKIGANGVGVERVFPNYSPFIDKVDVVASGIVRRSRLYYLRELSGKAARIRSRFVGKGKKVEIRTTEMPGSEQVAEEVVPEMNPKVAEIEKMEAAAAANKEAPVAPEVKAEATDDSKKED
jgi:large subunit ribosomal protein L19